MKNKPWKILATVLFAGVLLSTKLQAQDCIPCENNCCDDRYWVDVEYLYWKIKDSPKPPVLVISSPDSEVLLGGKEIENNWRSGGRFGLGGWFDDDRCFGAEANYFFLPTGTKSQTVSSSGLAGSPTLLIPFFDVTIPGESTTGLAIPDDFSGTATLKIANKMQGAELNGLMLIASDCNFDLSFLAGFRYWNFQETLKFTTSSPFIHTTDVFKTKDEFKAQNNFYGGQVGFGLDYVYNCFFFDFKAKVAIGAMCEEAIINGSLATNDFDGFTTVQTFPGGYFALPTNIGRHKTTHFSVIPETDIKLGYQWNDSLSFQVGYTFLYVSKMLWSTQEMDRNINPTQSVAISDTPTAHLVGEASPKAQLTSGNLWVQGLTVGLRYTF